MGDGYGEGQIYLDKEVESQIFALEKFLESPGTGGD